MKLFQSHHLVPLALAALLLSSCGADYQAKSKVKGFLKANLKNPDIEIIDCSSVDSTFRVNDSTVQVMRRSASPLVKSGAGYVKPTSPLRYVIVRYAAGKDTLKQTFYLDKDLTGVVAFKGGAS